ncbi:MAG: hypothetical protein ABSF37_07170 [Sedimentisphaerales bacterium]|jgi:hypothetical protein
MEKNNQSNKFRSSVKHSQVGVAAGFLFAVLLMLAAPAWADPIKVLNSNPHYFFYKDKPIVLITSDHHYGAVINRDFDYTRYLDSLSAGGMNLTRIYPGGMFEPPGKYNSGSPLGPAAGRHILPWAKSAQTGANPTLAEPGQPSYKFDLDKWNPEYFTRLKDFVETANRKNIIVEVAFFNGMYADCWPLMAMYHGNNIQSVGQYEANDCGLYTTMDPGNEDVVRYQKAYIAKITTELNEYDNVIFDLCDEPSLVGRPDGNIIVMPDGKVSPWLLAMKDAFLKTEEALPKKHVLGQTVQNLSPDFSRSAWCQWLPTEYVTPAGKAIDKDYAAGKPIVDVESDFFGFGLTGPYTVEDIRAEGWWFMLRGGAGCINLNREYLPKQETGGNNTQTIIVPQKKILLDFMNSLNLAGLSRFTDFEGVPSNAFASALSEPGKQYALYLFHGSNDGKWGAHFIAKTGTYQDTFTLTAVPAGEYKLEWVTPATGAIISKDTIKWAGGNLKVTTPVYSLDIAMRLRAD